MPKESKYEANRMFTPSDQFSPRLCPQLAQEIGLVESIILMQLEFWIAIGNHHRDGHKWVYKSIRDLQKDFPFWSPATINRAITSLTEKELIIIGNYNAYKYDKTRWFAINLDQAKTLKSIQVHVREVEDKDLEQIETNEPSHFETQSDQFGTRYSQNDASVPETTSETTSKSAGTAQARAQLSNGSKATGSPQVSTLSSQPTPLEVVTRESTPDPYKIITDVLMSEMQEKYTSLVLQPQLAMLE